MTEKRIGDYLIKVDHDETPLNPRTDWENLGTMVCFHGRYNLGDKHNYDHRDYDGWVEMKKAIEKNEDALIILPLFLYDHSEITISTSSFGDRWDSGQIGYIYVSKKRVREEYGVKRISPKLQQTALSVLEGEVKTYDQYLRGEVYQYRVYKVEKCDLGHTHKTELESCGGFFDEEECMGEAESYVKYYMDEDKKVVETT